MNVYRRYFRVDSGAIFDEAVKQHLSREDARKAYAQVIEDISAKEEYMESNYIAVALQFDNPDKHLYKKVKYGWWPKKSTNKKVYTNLQEIGGSVVSNKQVLDKAGLYDSPCIFTDRNCYTVTQTYLPASNVLVVTTPWYDEDPEELERYKADDTRYETNLDHLLWKPVDGMTEVKEWESSKLFEENNELAKAPV